MKAKSKKMRESLKEEILGTLMASGPFIGFLLFSILPLAASLVISFTEMKGFSFSAARFNGGRSYLQVIHSTYFFDSIKNTLVWLISVPMNMAISLYLANLLTKGLHGTRFMRTIAFIPSICSGVGVTLMWQWVLDPVHGVINTVLGWVNLGPIGFTSTAEWFLPSILLISIWIQGTNIVLMQSALRNVHESIKEAARIDGATEMVVFWKVVFPCVTPTLFYTLVTNLVVAMQEMQIMQLITSNGVGPGNKAITVAYYMYRMAWVNYGSEGMGMASALSWMVAVVVILVTRLNFWLSKKWVHYE